MQRHSAASEAPRPDVETYRATRRFGSLDGLRCLCIAAVLWHHGSVWSHDSARLLTRGFTGVDFFFVLSGFLITTLLVRERRRTGRISLRGFYWRRILRIVPVYFLVVTLLSLYFVGVKGETQYAELVPFYYLFLSNFLTEHLPNLAPTWSLSVEEQYYMVWPLLLVLVPRRWVLPLLAALVAVNLAAITGALTPLGITAVSAGPLVFKMFNATYAPILIGSALALALDSRRGYAALAPLAGQRWAPIVTLAMLFALLQVLPSDLRGWPNLVMHLSMAACLATLVVREDNVLHPVLGLRPVARVGEISYGIYLYHLIALQIATVALNSFAGANAWSVLIAYAMVSVLIADVSFRTYESWFLALKTKTHGRIRSATGEARSR